MCVNRHNRPGKFTIWAHWDPELLPVGAGGMFSGGSVASQVGCLCLAGGGVPVSSRLHHVCKIFEVAFWHGSHTAVWLWWSIAWCLYFAAFTFLCPRNSTARFLWCRTSARGFWSRIVFLLLWRTTSLLWPLSSHSWPGTCRTVPTFPDLLASPQ